MYTIQKGSLLKRISAALLDVILLVIMSVGFAYILSAITKYDSWADKLEEKYTYYEETYDVKFDLSLDEVESMPEEEKQRYEEVQEIVNKDEDMIYYYNKLITLTEVIVSIGLFLGVLVTEFVVPLIFKNGETVGKRIFSLNVTKTNGVKITTVQLFARAILGKYTIELMLPITLLILASFNVLSSVSTIMVIGFTMFNLLLTLLSPNKTSVHDLLAMTMVVDKNQTKIFDTEEDLIKYKEDQSLEEVQSIRSLK